MNSRIDKKWLVKPYDYTFVISSAILAVACIVIEVISQMELMGIHIPNWVGIIGLVPVIGILIWIIGLIQIIIFGGAFRVRAIILIITPPVIFVLLFILAMGSMRLSN